MGNEIVPSSRVAAVVLAAGEASRFGSPKQRLLVPLVLERLAAAGLSEVVVVTGAYPLTVEAARVVAASDWQRGPGASLRAGLAALPEETEAAVVVLADGPLLAPSSIERVLRAWQEGLGNVVSASYCGARGHPLLVARPAWGSIPDEGLRSLPATLVPCDDLGPPGDVDTPEDLAALGLDRLGEESPASPRST